MNVRHVRSEARYAILVLFLFLFIILFKQCELFGWEDSWKLSSEELQPNYITDDETFTVSSSMPDTTVIMGINNVFLPGWTDSWLLATSSFKEKLHKDWNSCWVYWQTIRYVSLRTLEPNHISRMHPFPCNNQPFVTLQDFVWFPCRL